MTRPIVTISNFSEGDTPKYLEANEVVGPSHQRIINEIEEELQASALDQELQDEKDHRILAVNGLVAGLQGRVQKHGATVVTGITSEGEITSYTNTEPDIGTDDLIGSGTEGSEGYISGCVTEPKIQSVSVNTVSNLLVDGGFSATKKIRRGTISSDLLEEAVYEVGNTPVNPHEGYPLVSEPGYLDISRVKGIAGIHLQPNTITRRQVETTDRTTDTTWRNTGLNTDNIAASGITNINLDVQCVHSKNIQTYSGSDATAGIQNVNIARQAVYGDVIKNNSIGPGQLGLIGDGSVIAYSNILGGSDVGVTSFIGIDNSGYSIPTLSQNGTVVAVGTLHVKDLLCSTAAAGLNRLFLRFVTETGNVDLQFIAPFSGTSMTTNVSFPFTFIKQFTGSGGAFNVSLSWHADRYIQTTPDTPTNLGSASNITYFVAQR